MRVLNVAVCGNRKFTWINRKRLEGIGVRPEKKDIRFVMENGRKVTRSIGFAIVRIGKRFTTDEVVFARKGDLQVLGERTLEGLKLRVDSRNKRLVEAGPVVAGDWK